MAWTLPCGLPCWSGALVSPGAARCVNGGGFLGLVFGAAELGGAEDYDTRWHGVRGCEWRRPGARPHGAKRPKHSDAACRQALSRGCGLEAERRHAASHVRKGGEREEGGVRPAQTGLGISHWGCDKKSAVLRMGVNNGVIQLQFLIIFFTKNEKIYI